MKTTRLAVLKLCCAQGFLHFETKVALRTSARAYAQTENMMHPATSGGSIEININIEKSGNRQGTLHLNFSWCLAQIMFVHSNALKL